MLWDFDDARSFPGHSPPARRDWGPCWSWVAWRAYIGFGSIVRRKDPEKFRLCVDIKLPKQKGEQQFLYTISDYVKDIDGGGLYQHWLP